MKYLVYIAMLYFFILMCGCSRSTAIQKSEENTAKVSKDTIKTETIYLNGKEIQKATIVKKLEYE